MSEGAKGNPAVCVSTCSTVTVSFPFGANSGMIAATRSPTSRSPSPISFHTTPATIERPTDWRTYRVPACASP